MTRFVVVSGTDTDVGKTFVTEALGARLARGRRVVAIKPFESGARQGDGDGERLARATGQRAPLHALVRLREPITPALAADREGRVIDWPALVAEIRALGVGADVVLVEGAGGVLSPLTWDHDVRDLAAALDAQVVLVAADRLGTLSTTHAAVHVLADAGRTPCAIVMSSIAQPDASSGANAEALRRRLGPLGEVAQRITSLPRCELAVAEEALAPLAVWIDQPIR